MMSVTTLLPQLTLVCDVIERCFPLVVVVDDKVVERWGRGKLLRGFGGEVDPW